MAAVQAATLTPEKLYRLNRQRLEEVQPWVQMQVNLMNLQPERLILSRRGDLIARETLWDPKCKETYDLIEQIKADIWESLKNGAE